MADHIPGSPDGAPASAAPPARDLTPRPPSASRTILAQVMLPTDANPNGHVHGGTIMKLVDTAGGTAAVRHARRPVATVIMDSMTFLHPVYVGNLVTVEATVTWTGRTSLETRVEVRAEDTLSGRVTHTSTAYLVFVALDEQGRPTPVPPLELTTDEERRLWREAEARREYRLASRGRAPTAGAPAGAGEGTDRPAGERGGG
jgi:acyl-CoA hydrolase